MQSQHRSIQWSFFVLLALTGQQCHAQNITRNGEATLPPLPVSISTHDISVLVDEYASFTVQQTGVVSQIVQLKFVPDFDNLVDILPSPSWELHPDGPSQINFTLRGRHPGHMHVYAETVAVADGSDFGVEHVFMRVTIAISNAVIYVSSVVGWLYFVAWSVSFYPQIYYNYRRKSVIGLNFDFCALNVFGFLMYSMFNVGLYFIPHIETEYLRRNPRGLNPIQVNDIVFALHALLATIVQVGQCFIYERGQQRVSWTARGFLGAASTAVVVMAILSGTSVMHWLDFLVYSSYIKLCITIIKYIPQALMNFRRKSTVGWSIWNVLLDFTGGVLSMLQMFLNAFNYNDWASIFGDATKFGLGFFSVAFDVFFMLQHYWFYRHARTTPDESKADTINTIA